MKAVKIWTKKEEDLYKNATFPFPLSHLRSSNDVTTNESVLFIHDKLIVLQIWKS